LAWI